MNSEVVSSGADAGARVAPETREGERSEPERGAGATRASGRGQGPTADTEMRTRERRTFNAAYKARILREAAACTGPGEVGALLRRESLYSSHLAAWRKQRDASDLKGLAPRKRGPVGKSAEAKRVEQLKRANAKLEEELRKANIIIAFQKKVHSLLGIPLPELPDLEKR